MMVTAQKDAKVARLAPEKMKEKLVEQAEAYQGLFAKHEGLLKSAKKSNEQAKWKIAELAEKAGQTSQLEEENAQLRAEMERERSDRVVHAVAWAAQNQRSLLPRHFLTGRLPLHGLLRDIFRHFGFAPGQLTANAHKYVASYILRCCALDKTPTLDEFLILFSIGGPFPYYSLFAHPQAPIFERVEFKHDKWSHYYFVIEFPVHSPLDLPGVVHRSSISRTKFVAVPLAEAAYNALREEVGLIPHHSLQDARLYKKADFYYPLGPDPVPFEGVSSPERSEAPPVVEPNPTGSSSGSQAQGNSTALAIRKPATALEAVPISAIPGLRKPTPSKKRSREGVTDDDFLPKKNKGDGIPASPSPLTASSALRRPARQPQPEVNNTSPPAATIPEGVEKEADRQKEPEASPATEKEVGVEEGLEASSSKQKEIGGQKDTEAPPETERETERQQEPEKQHCNALQTGLTMTDKGKGKKQKGSKMPSFVSLARDSLRLLRQSFITRSRDDAEAGCSNPLTNTSTPEIDASGSPPTTSHTPLHSGASTAGLQANLGKMKESVQEPITPQARPDLLALNALHSMEQAQQSLLTLTEEYLGGAWGNYRAVVVLKEKELAARALQQKVDSLEGTQDLETQFDRLLAQISLLESKASASEDKVGSLKAELVERESRISELENSLHDAKQEGPHLNDLVIKHIEAKWLTLGKLEKERQTASELRSRMGELEKTIAAHQGEVAALTTRAEALYEEGKFDMQHCIYEAVQSGLPEHRSLDDFISNYGLPLPLSPPDSCTDLGP
ncbi:unnamed protein product [Cuscuta campestris]|uniref:Uncharacterized protein n=1 Tax=Cuscuta campestris TaxID=132261 RepID=A0A484LSV2_9ASTE|nr:unnamed protein product [Cuscuta campestris]